MEGHACGHVSQLHLTEGHCLHPGASHILEVGRPIKEGHSAARPLSNPGHAGSLCWPPFSRWYQLWSLGLMFAGQKDWGRARVGGVRKREDLKTPLGGHSPRSSRCLPGSSRCGHCPRSFCLRASWGCGVPGSRVKPPPTEVGRGR